MNIVSLFSGVGGLDLGFKMAGFSVLWANEYDKTIWETYEKNHPDTYLEKRSIKEINLNSELPDCDLIIGGPPCQSWSEAGTKKGIQDDRGKLFFSFTEAISVKKPKLFLAENVPGILSPRNEAALKEIIHRMENNGEYIVLYKKLNAADFNSCQDRNRVIFIGIRKDFMKAKKIEENELEDLLFPEKLKKKKKTIKDSLFDLRGIAKPFDKTSPSPVNHDYLVMGFSPMFMSRNRIKGWEQQAFTIQASGRHSPLHPDSGTMDKVGKDLFVFSSPEKVRRYTVRESARIQGFPDDFIFYYKDVLNGYKMVGNAVSVDMSYAIACHLKRLFN